jgi:hypothetical protein
LRSNPIPSFATTDAGYVDDLAPVAASAADQPRVQLNGDFLRAAGSRRADQTIATSFRSHRDADMKISTRGSALMAGSTTCGLTVTPTTLSPPRT